MTDSTKNPVKPGIYRDRFAYEANYTQIKNSWMRDPNLSMKAKGLLVYFMTHEVGYVITLNQIEREMADGKSAIRSAISELVSNGYLLVERTTQNNGWNGGLAYILSEPAKTSMSENPTLENPTLENRITKEQNLIKNKKELRNIDHQTSFEVDFDHFWNLYPRKVGKETARVAWAKALEKASVDEVVAGVFRFANDPNLPDKVFIPHPATWLNQGRWDDEPYPVRPLSAEKLSQLQQEAIEQRRAADRAHAEELRREAAEARAKASPVPECEHGNKITKCRKCLLGLD